MCLIFLIIIKYDPESLSGPQGQSLMPWGFLYQTLMTDLWGIPLARKMSNLHRAGFLNLGIIDIWSQWVLCCGGRGASLCSAGWLAASLTSITQCQQHILQLSQSKWWQTKQNIHVCVCWGWGEQCKIVSVKNHWVIALHKRTQLQS